MAFTKLQLVGGALSMWMTEILCWSTGSLLDGLDWNGTNGWFAFGGFLWWWFCHPVCERWHCWMFLCQFCFCRLSGWWSFVSFHHDLALIWWETLLMGSRCSCRDRVCWWRRFPGQFHLGSRLTFQVNWDHRLQCLVLWRDVWRLRRNLGQVLFAVTEHGGWCV